jgi:hypothetical protein
MAISIPLVFHFNQHLTERSLVASLACYRGLLRVLRAHPLLPVNIQISGTLIDALRWLDPEPLQEIWEGLRAGQFELLGSTYAQNVPYASDDWDNARQIEMHQEVIYKTFGVTPVTFWNPERSWRQSLLPIISAAGYRSTLVEDFILAQARLAEPVVVTSQVGPHILTLLCDDQQLKHLFNFAAWFGRPGQLQSYLMQRARHANANEHCLAYAEDAEAMGLWGWKEGIVPNQTWYRLDQVLSLLEAMPEIQLVHLTNSPASAGNLSPIPDGTGTWMDISLQHPDLPYHEPGYKDWFDFNENSPKLQKYRQFFGEIRDELQAVAEEMEAGRKSRAVRNLYQLALHNYLGHQYEFGCIGIGGDHYRGWDGAQASYALLEAARWAMEPRPVAEVADVNRDGQDELVLGDGRQAIITSPDGARLLYWFDLEAGEQYVGNQRAVTDAPYEYDAALPPLETLDCKLWLPEEARPQAIMHEAQLTPETTPTRMDKYLPSWVLEGERQPFELLTRAMKLPGETELRPAQRRGLVDFITVDGIEADASERVEGEPDSDGICYQRVLPGDIHLGKHYRLVPDGVEVTYRWHNSGEGPCPVTWRLVSELTPAYGNMMRTDRSEIQFIEDEERPGVANTSARQGIFVEAEPLADEVVYREALLALEIELGYEFELAGGEQHVVRIRLQREAVQKKKRRRR